MYSNSKHFTDFLLSGVKQKARKISAPVYLVLPVVEEVVCERGEAVGGPADVELLGGRQDVLLVHCENRGTWPT